MATTIVTSFNPHPPLRDFLSLAREWIEVRVE
jgi:hypothetical protein